MVELFANSKLPVSTNRFKLGPINAAFDCAQDKQDSGAVFVAIAIAGD